MKKTFKHIIFCLIVVGLMLDGTGRALADTYNTNFESFTLGDVNTQDGWTSGHGSSFCPVYDVEVVSNTYGYTSLGAQALRISNAITCGSFNDMTFSKSLANEAGETSADTTAYSGGIRQPYFEAQWDFASTVPGAEQPGLSVVASPDRGDPGRMSWLQMQDTPTGLQLNFEDYDHSVLNFTTTPIATSLDRTIPHTVKITMQFVDGPSNDIVKIYLDGVLIHTGTTWEDYYRDFEGGFPHPVDSIMFRTAGTAAPVNSGKGFLIDNFSSMSGPVPPTTGTLHVIKHVINDNGGVATASTFSMHVKQGGTDVSGSPASGQESPGNTYTLAPNTYVVSEDANTSYTQTFSGDCDSSGNITLSVGDNKTCTITNDDIAPTPPPSGGSSQPSEGTITVVNTVINDNGGTKKVADFPLFVNGTPVISGVANYFRAPAEAYRVTETADPNYTQTFSGDCNNEGYIGLNRGDNDFCVITNDDIGTHAAAPAESPIIDLMKTASTSTLPKPGRVTYTYTLRNAGTVPVTDITMVGDTCSPIKLVSGDINSDSKLDINETWVYKCSWNLTETHTNTVTATGWANGMSVSEIASATVIVGASTVPPSIHLIHVTKTPNPSMLSAGGGWVTYTEKITNPGTVALQNVRIMDDKCVPMKYISGDTNKNSMLDIAETWTYTCRTHLTKTTTNTAIARGEANGLSVSDIIIATVPVASSASATGQQIRTISANLGMGSRGNDVKILQLFLISQNKGSASLILAKAGATGYFGSLTRDALAEFQIKTGIKPALGNFGPITRAYFSAIYK
jgi:uncharacterized repeat protein (TIGR01451 family)